MTRQASTTSLASPGRIVSARESRAATQLLDRLMRRAVLADADRIVREDVDDRNLHQRGQPDRRTAVVGEDEEARAEGRTFESDRPFSTAPMACSRMPKWMLRPPTCPPAGRRRRRTSMRVLVEGARSAEPPISHGIFLATALSTFADASRPATPFGVGGKCREVLRPSRRAARRRCIRSTASASVGILPPCTPRSARASRARSLAPRAPMPLEMLAHAVGHEEFRVLGPAVEPLGRAGFPLRPSGSPCAACVSCLCGAP